MAIKAKSLKEYEDFIAFIEKFINDRERMLDGVNERISDYTSRLSNASGEYKKYCEDRIKEEKELLEDISIKLRNAKDLRTQLVESYENDKLNK